MCAVQDIAFHLERLVQVLSVYYTSSETRLAAANVFPIEVDLKRVVLSSHHQREEDHDYSDNDQEEQLTAVYKLDQPLVELADQ